MCFGFEALTTVVFEALRKGFQKATLLKPFPSSAQKNQESKKLPHLESEADLFS